MKMKVSRQRIWQRRWEDKHPKEYRERTALHNQLAKENGNSRRWYLKRKYGITPEQWQELFEKQGKKCAVCERSYEANSPKWHTDHNHATGKVRGILCDICNRIVMPAVEHYQVLLSKAKLYLEN